MIIQARHWLSKSLSLADVTVLLAQVSLWEPPVVNNLIIATSGKFTTDAIEWIERHNAEGARPWIDMWAETHLERLLAARPHLAAGLGLRQRGSGS